MKQLEGSNSCHVIHSRVNIRVVGNDNFRGTMFKFPLLAASTLVISAALAAAPAHAVPGTTIPGDGTYRVESISSPAYIGRRGIWLLLGAPSGVKRDNSRHHCQQLWRWAAGCANRAVGRCIQDKRLRCLESRLGGGCSARGSASNDARTKLNRGASSGRSALSGHRWPVGELYSVRSRKLEDVLSVRGAGAGGVRSQRASKFDASADYSGQSGYRGFLHGDLRCKWVVGDLHRRRPRHRLFVLRGDRGSGPLP